MGKRNMLDPNAGALIGTMEGVGVHDPTTEHVLTIAPSGSGKTIARVVGDIFHLAMLGYSQVINDCKPELVHMTRRALVEEIGCRVVVNNVFQVPGVDQHQDSNPLQILIDDFASVIGQKNMIHDAVNIALQLLAEPEQSDKNKWVRDGGRSFLIAVSAGLAAISPKSCTLSQMLKIISNVEELLRYFKALATQTDILNGDLSDIANDALSAHENNIEHFEYYRKAAIESLSAFVSSGHLGGVGTSHDYAYDQLRDENAPPLIIFNVCPLEHLEVAKPYFGLVYYTCLQTLKRHTKGRKVAMILDEFTNFKVTNIVQDMTTLRQLRVRCFIYAQSESEIARVYGDKMLTTIRDQSRTKIYFGVKDRDVAKRLEELLGSATTHTENYSYPDDIAGAGKGNQTISQTGRPLLYLSEIVAMDSDTLIAFVDNKIIRGKKITYAQVWPWCDWVEANPLEGGKLVDKIKLRIHYGRQATNWSLFRSILSRILPKKHNSGEARHV